MKKRLLMVAFALLTVATSFAFEIGDYAYNSTQRFKIIGENLVTNGNFANGREGWYGVDEESAPDATVWDLVPGAGPNGETVLQSLAIGQPLRNSWKLPEGGRYVVSFDIYAPNAGYTTTVTFNDKGEASVGNNVADFFLNGDGNLVKLASTDDAPVVTVAAQTNFPQEEWKTIVFGFAAEDGQSLVMHFENLDKGIQITNIEVHKADEVYDIRIAQNRIAFAKEVLANENFNVEAAQDAKANLEEVYIAGIEEMIENGGFDDASEAEGMMAEFEEALEAYLSVTSVNLKTLIPGLDIANLGTYWGRAGKFSDSYKLSLSGNWGHLESEADVLRSAIQSSYDHEATYACFHEDLPAGKYFFTAEIRNSSTNSTSWPCNLTFNATSVCKIFIGTDSVDTDPIYGEEFQRFSIVADVAEDGAVRAGVYWPGMGSKGGAFMIRNTQLRAFDLDALTKADHIAAFKTYMTQWNAAVSGRNNLYNTIGNPNYPWGQNELITAREKYDPYFHTQNGKGWTTAEGTDAGIASTDELKDWALYQGIEEYSEPTEEGAEPTRLEYQLVRGYQNAVNAAKTTNKPLTDLADAINAAKATRNNNANLTGDRDTYKTAILTALASLNEIRSNTTDATYEADTARAGEAQRTLAAATEAFLGSVGVKPFVDIDFSNAAVENTDEEITEPYYIQGEAGKIYFSTYEEDNNTNAVFTLGNGEEMMDVLRVGNGKATVYFSEENLPGENDALRFTFDMYHGNLTGKFAGVELQNAAGERVAGFYIDRYNANVSYNDFNDVIGTSNGGTGMDLRQYSTGLGSSSVGNAGICVASNKTSYDLVVDYKNKTLQGTIVNGKGQTNEGAPQPFRAEITDQVIAKFVVVSNYNNAGRRCWFDNLKISKYSLGGEDVVEDITENPWIEYVVDGIKSVSGDASNASAIYTISGVKVNKASKPGLYIQNGKKFVVK